MTIRITTIPESSQTIVKVDGRLQLADVDELVQMLQGLTGPAALDLTELQSVDRAAVTIVARTHRSGCSAAHRVTLRQAAVGRGSRTPAVRRRRDCLTGKRFMEQLRNAHERSVLMTLGIQSRFLDRY